MGFGSTYFLVLTIFAFSKTSSFGFSGGSEFQINHYDNPDHPDCSSSMYYPHIAVFDSGNFVVVWCSNGQSGSDHGVGGQIFSESGLKVDEFLITSNVIDDESLPKVAVLKNGKFVVTWGRSRDDPYGQIFDETGNKIGNEFQINTYTSDRQYPAYGALLNNGNFVVTWNSWHDGSGYGVCGQIFDETGSKVDSEFRVNTYTVGYQRSWYPATVLNNGNFVVVWESEGQDGSDYSIYGQIVNESGIKVGSEFQVNTYTTGTQTNAASMVFDNGNFVVVWTVGSQNIHGQIFDDSGIKIGNEFQVNTYTTTIRIASALAVLENDIFVVTWWGSNEQDESGYGVYAQVFDNIGAKIGSEFQINTYVANNQARPYVVALNDNRFLVAWTSDGQGGSGCSIYGRIFSPFLIYDCAEQVIDDALTITPDCIPIQSAKVAMSGDVDLSIDSFGFTNQNGISGYYDDDAGELVLNGDTTTTATQYQTALRSVTFNRDGMFLSSESVIVSFTVNDGTCEMTTREISVDGDVDCGKVCSGNWDPGNECQTCIGNWEIERDCRVCKLNWDPGNECQTCIGNWQIERDCQMCKLGWVNENNDCQTFGNENTKLTIIILSVALSVVFISFVVTMVVIVVLFVFLRQRKSPQIQYQNDCVELETNTKSVDVAQGESSGSSRSGSSSEESSDQPQMQLVTETKNGMTQQEQSVY